MQRRWHYLKPNENSETLWQCIFVDTETDPYAVDEIHTGHRLRFGWAAFTRRTATGAWSKPAWKRFTDYEDFWLWANAFPKPGKKTWIWCHNSSFDYPVLHAFSHLPLIGWKLESAIIDAPPTIVTYRSGRKTLVLSDTLNIWRMSLAELGKRIGLDKLTRPEAWGETENDDYYCRRDVEIIYKSITEWADFLVREDMGGFSPTIASQSMRAFRHRWLTERILIDNCDLANDLGRKCYHGGRCEAARIGTYTGDFYYLDINSMYPFVMSYARMPLRLRGISRRLSVRHMSSLLKQYCVCAHVRLNTDHPAFAVVHEGKLCFPVGRFDAHLSTPEIEYALHIGAIEEVYLAGSYDYGVPFRQFALDLYEHKEAASRNGREIESRHWKLLLNSFYGKWGQSGRKWVQCGTCDPLLFERERSINAQTKKRTVRRKFGGLVFELADDGESAESHPAIAAHITAEARMVLWALIRQLAPEDYFYCDTDAVLVSASGRNTLRDRLDQHKLGGLKEAHHFQEITIYGCKDLVLDGKATLKGIRPTAQRLNDKTYRQIKWSSLRGLLGAGSLDMPLTVSVDKTLRREYTKGTVGKDGFVFPLHFPIIAE